MAHPVAGPLCLLLDDGTSSSDEEIVGYLAILLIGGHDTGATMYGRSLRARDDA